MAEGQTQLQQLQEGAEEVRGIMLENYNKAKEREGKLEELDDRAEKLLQHAEKFEKTTRRVKEKMESENTRNKKVIAVVAGAVVLVLVIIIIAAVFLSR